MRTWTILSRLATLLAASSVSRADDKTDLAKVSTPAGLLATGAATTVAARLALLEGPAFDDKGGLFFSDVYGNRIYKMTPGGRLGLPRRQRPDQREHLRRERPFDQLRRRRARARRPPPHRPHRPGDGQGQGPDRALRGQAVQQPQRRRRRRRGRVRFTDPFYGDDRSALEQDAEAVYRIDPDGSVGRVLSQPTIERPNGLALTPDGKTLYVVDSHVRPGGNRKVWAFDVADDGTPGRRRLVLDLGKGRGGDGLRLDERGNLWVAAGIMFPRHAGETADVSPGVYVITPEGKLVGRIPIPDTEAELEKYRRLGMEEVASGKWPEGEANRGTFHYVRDAKGVVVEFISRINRK